MTLISVTAVENSPIQLINNANFASFWAGAPAPEGFQAPAADISTLRHAPAAPAGGLVLRQTWSEPDHGQAPPPARFRVESAPVEQGKAYRLTVEAMYAGEPVIRVLVSDAAEADNPERSPIARLVMLPGDGLLKRYQRSIVPQFSGRLLIESTAEGPTSIDWYRWSLEPLGNT